MKSLDDFKELQREEEVRTSTASESSRAETFTVQAMFGTLYALSGR